MSHFLNYLKKKYPDKEKLTNQLIEIVINDPDCDIIWDLLQQTGEERYTHETFKKIAEEILNG